MNDTLLSDRIAMLERQSHAILVLSAVNMFANLLTIGVALLVAWPR